MDRKTQLRHLGLFDARVPRYTSYPTANHFSDSVGPDEARAWIAAIPPGTRLSLYVHIPFCRRLCWFCACRTQGTVTDAPVRAYLGTLTAELARVAALLPAGVEIAHLHWGGGTPTLMGPAAISGLARAIARAAPFAADAEFSVEIDPNQIDEARLDALTAAGITRASIGVQDFDPEVQSAIGRPQSFARTREIVDALRSRGIQSLNIDLLYGLPHQTPERMAESVQKVLSLAPDRAAVYGYAHVPWLARRQGMIPVTALPTPEARLKLYEIARDLFVWDGYRPVGIDHFARPGDGLARAAATGRLCRNFQGYTDDPSPVLVGVGASAISQFPQGYAQNDPSTSGYHARIGAGGLATARGHAFSGDDPVRGAVIAALMCGQAVDFASMGDRFGVPAARIAELAAGIDAAFPGAVALSRDRLEIAAEAVTLTRMIARYFDAYASPETAHSAAI